MHDQVLNDLKWNVVRPQGMEAVMRVRCSTGLAVDGYQVRMCVILCLCVQASRCTEWRVSFFLGMADVSCLPWYVKGSIQMYVHAYLRRWQRCCQGKACHAQTCFA